MTEPPRWMPCEWAWEGKHEKRRKKGQENEEGGTTKTSKWREGEEEKKKRQRNKCCPPENWHAEGQHLLRIVGPTLDECTRTHTRCRMLAHTVHVLNETEHLSGLLSVFVNKVLSNMINPPGYHELQTDQSRKLTWLHSLVCVSMCVYTFGNMPCVYQGMNESHCEGVRVHNTEDSYLTAEAKKKTKPAGN